jgi:hypothetical protein
MYSFHSEVTAKWASDHEQVVIYAIGINLYVYPRSGDPFYTIGQRIDMASIAPAQRTNTYTLSALPSDAHFI